MLRSELGRTRARASLLALATAAFAALLVVGTGSPASAHDELLDADPANGEVVEQLPETLTLTFSGVLIGGEGATELAVTDAAGTDLTAGDPALDGVRVTQALAGDPQGTVRVAWRVVSSDGHPVSGEFSFIVGEAGASPDPDAGTATPPAETSGDASGWLWAGALAIAVVIAFATVLLTRRRPSRED